MSRQGKSTTPTTSLILLFLLICVMLLKASTASQEESGQEMACTDCIQSSKVWCALTNQCVFTSSECNYKHNVTWFSLPSKTNVKNIPTHCVTGIFTSLDQCPSTQSMYHVRLSKYIGLQFLKSLCNVVVLCLKI